MLKSTHKQEALPPGWTEHRAPTGHLYYYHAETKRSTYTRPVIQEEKAPEPQSNAFVSQADSTSAPSQFESQYDPQHRPFVPQQNFPVDPNRPRHRYEHLRKPTPEDSPKHKQSIPGAAPWVLVRTKLKRRFVHNPETGESLWKFPADVMKCVVELDKVERERKARRAKGETSDTEEATRAKANAPVKINEAMQEKHDYDSVEYEEVEVTDEEDEQEVKRQRIGESPPGPVEFNEDDIAFQLAQMEQMAADDYGDIKDYEEAPALGEEDARALFVDLLNDLRISPFTPWDKIIEEGAIIEDDRYTVLPNMKSRKEVFDDWVRVKAQEVRKLREEQTKQDPRVPYMALLDKHATSKLYWPEFRRKYQKEPEMKHRNLSDKDREKWYREHINRLKLSHDKLKADLIDLLGSLPTRELNSTTSLDALPSSLLRDIRYISLSPRRREPIVKAYLASAPPPPETLDATSAEEEAGRAKERAERQRREKALADRVYAVNEQKAKQRKDLGYSKALLREEEAEISRAMKIARDGLIRHMEE